jgi:hypothetical protein
LTRAVLLVVPVGQRSDALTVRLHCVADLVPYLGDLQHVPGKRVFLATSHIGPPALHARGIDAAWLSSVPNFLDRAFSAT